MLGCTTTAHQPRPENFPSNLDQQVVLRKAVGAASVSTVRGLYRIDYDSEGERGSGRLAVICSKGKLRIELLPEIGFYSLVLFVADRNNFYFEEKSQNKVFRGDASVDSIYRKIKLAIPLWMIPGIVTGRISEELLSDLVNSTAPVINTSRRNLIHLQTASRKYHYLLNQDGEIEELIVKDLFKDVVVFHVSYERGYLDSNQQIPRKLSISLPENHLSFDLIVDKMSINSNIQDFLFDKVNSQD